MKKTVWVILSTLILLFPVYAAEYPDPGRGKLLYENHCDACHEDHVHMREGRKVRTRQQVAAQVRRWAEELSLSWRGPDINDVTEFLYLNFYQSSD